MRDRIAALEHEQWAHWTKYMLDNLTPENIAQWNQQIDTPYSELTEKEKDSDRVWADKVLALEVPGWVMETVCPLKHLGAYCKQAQTQINCDDYLDNSVQSKHIKCYKVRPATQAEVNSREAVWNDR